MDAPINDFPVSFKLWTECSSGVDAGSPEEYFYHVVGLRQTTIDDGSSTFGLPYLPKRRDCTNFEEYKEVWVEELSREVDLKVLGLGLDHRVFAVLPQCYEAYSRAKRTDIIPRGYKDWLDGSFLADQGAERKREADRRSRIWAKAYPNRPLKLETDVGIFHIPFLVKGHCDNFTQYWDRWFTQIGPFFNLVDNNITSGERLESLLLLCYNQFQNIMQHPEFDEIVLGVAEEDSSGVGTDSELEVSFESGAESATDLFE